VLRPSLFLSIDRLKLSLDRITQNLQPDHLGFSECEADATVLEHAGIAGHGMWTAYDAMNTVSASEGCKIQAALELMRLHSDQSQQSRFVGTAKQVEVREVGLDILVDRHRFNVHAVKRRRRHTAKVWDSTIRHEAATEAFDVTAHAVFTRLKNNDAKHLQDDSAARQLRKVTLFATFEVLSCVERGRRVLHEYKGNWPKLGERVYIAEGAQIIGDVEIGDHSSVWYNCVIRGDVDIIRIGRHT
jgi:hypothetical protein